MIRDRDTILKTSVILCSTCDGSGRVDSRVSSDESVTIDCDTCKGTGRLIETISVRPYETQ